MGHGHAGQRAPRRELETEVAPPYVAQLVASLVFATLPWSSKPQILYSFELISPV